MSSSLQTGVTATTRVSIDEARTISFMGDEGRVYATPELVRDIENCCRNLLLEHIDEGQDSVGTSIDLSHTAPTPFGMWVDITVTVTDVSGRAVTFDVVARDPIDEICHAGHRRFVVDVASTLKRIRAKRETANAATEAPVVNQPAV
ncbi:MAG TPA: hypothetical protein VE175_07865 [Woeseiaceae bacterium]|nr:hypothetical protein [Woeseiaceae bacterium]